MPMHARPLLDACRDGAIRVVCRETASGVRKPLRKKGKPPDIEARVRRLRRRAAAGLPLFAGGE